MVHGIRRTLLLIVWLGLFTPGPAVLRAATPVTPPLDDRPFLLHLPGIAGETTADRNLVRGLIGGGLEAEARIYDWTGDNPGLPALFARQRNQAESTRIAELIREVARTSPDRKIFITAHSGGTGLAVWALEQLPEDILIDGALLMAPALSPGYDLSRALRHVRGQMYVFTSPLDLAILGAGTQVFGTIDGVKCDAAGLVGFVYPANADAEAYARLVPKPYDAAWMRLGNLGDHIGPLSRAFAAEVLAPLLIGHVAETLPVPTTQPAGVGTDE